jgi:hypothetical protein
MFGGTVKKKHKLKTRCRVHKDNTAEFICDDCGESFCWSCLRTEGPPYICPECIGPYSKRIRRSMRLTAGGAVAAALLIVTMPFIAVALADAYEQWEERDDEDGDDVEDEVELEPYSRVWLNQDEIYMGLVSDSYDSRGDDKAAVEITVYLTNSGEADSGEVKMEALALLNNIVMDDAGTDVGAVGAVKTVKVEIGSLWLRPNEAGNYRFDLKVWEGGRVTQTVTMTMRITQTEVSLVDTPKYTYSDGGGTYYDEESYGSDENEPPSWYGDGSDGGGTAESDDEDDSAEKMAMMGTSSGLDILPTIFASTFVILLGGWQYGRLKSRLKLRNPKKGNVPNHKIGGPAEKDENGTPGQDIRESTPPKAMPWLEGEPAAPVSADVPGYQSISQSEPEAINGANGRAAAPAGPVRPFNPPTPPENPQPSVEDVVWVDQSIAENSTKDRILAYVRLSPGSTQQEIADALDLPKQTVSYNVNQLRWDGSIQTIRDGRSTRCYPEEG